MESVRQSVVVKGELTKSDRVKDAFMTAITTILQIMLDDQKY